MKKNQNASRKKGQRFDTKNLNPSSLEQATQILGQGGLIIFPTDTFYGIGVGIRESAAINRVYQIKGRDPSKPLLVVAADIAMALSLCGEVSPQTRTLMQKFWPGPLTLLLPARSDLSSRLVSKDGTIGVRVPDHRISLDLLRQYGIPLTATSANKSGESSPATADEARRSIGKKVDFVLDGGPSPGGKESTIVDTTLDPPRLVREGAVPFSQIMESIGITLTDLHDW